VVFAGTLSFFLNFFYIYSTLDLFVSFIADCCEKLYLDCDNIKTEELQVTLAETEDGSYQVLLAFHCMLLA
jgi:hypothetical protein